MNTDRLYAESLANEYAPKDTSKVTALRKLDHKAKRPATVFAYTLGIAASLLAGAGMCFSMNVIGDGTMQSMILGCVLGVIGFAGMGANYPIYKHMLAKSKQKYAFDIITLANEVSGLSD